MENMTPTKSEDRKLSFMKRKSILLMIDNCSSILKPNSQKWIVCSVIKKEKENLDDLGA